MMSNPAILAALPNIAQAILGGRFNFPLNSSQPPTMNPTSVLPLSSVTPSLNTPTLPVNKPLSNSQNSAFHNIDPRNPNKFTNPTSAIPTHTNSNAYTNMHPHSFPQNPQVPYATNFGNNTGAFHGQHNFGTSSSDPAIGMWDYEDDDVDDEQRISELKARRAEEEKRVRAEASRYVFNNLI